VAISNAGDDVVDGEADFRDSHAGQEEAHDARENDLSGIGRTVFRVSQSFHYTNGASSAQSASDKDRKSHWPKLTVRTVRSSSTAIVAEVRLTRREESGFQVHRLVA